MLIVTVGALITPSAAMLQEVPDITVPDLDSEALLMAELVEARVTFVDPFGITHDSDLKIGAPELLAAGPANLAQVTDGGNKSAVDDLQQVPAQLTITAAPHQPITIVVDEVVPGAGYSLSEFRCNYNDGSDRACDGPGILETSVANGTLLVDATLTGNGTREAGGRADGRFEVTISYQ